MASQLIDEGINLMLVGNTPETTNPVSDQCEANGMPCISSLAPWQPWFFRTKDADPSKPYKWTYHFFWGLEDIIAVFLDMWSQVDTNKVVGALWPNDGDGNAWGDKTLGFPPALTAAGYTVVDPGRYNNLTSDFSAQIGQFKTQNVQILTGVPLPPDFTTFWTQAQQQGFTPKIASVGKALLFPASVDALGDSGDGLSSEVWWSPSHPFASSLVDLDAKQLADSYEATGKQWTQPLGFAHALFEVAIDAFNKAGLDGEGRADRPDPQDQPRHDRRQGAVGGRLQGAGQRGQDTARRRPVDQDQRRQVQVRPRHRVEQGPPEHPGGGQAPPDPR